MSEEGLEVPETRRGGGGIEQSVAIFTAILAAFGAVVGFQGAHLMNEVLLRKNDAVLKKAEATDEWNHYQSLSTKSHLSELAQELVTPDRGAQFADRISKYAAQRDELMAHARVLDAESERANAEADELNRPHSRLALAMTFLQLAISIASITALTQRRWLFAVAIASAAAAIGLWVFSVVVGA